MPDRPAAPCAGGSVLGDGSELERAFATAAPEIVMVVFGAAGRGLKPLSL
jgi:hypothetical protein